MKFGLLNNALSAVILSAFSMGTAAHASGGQTSWEIIDMTTDLSGDMIVTTGFLDDLDLIAFEQSVPSIARGAISLNADESPVSGWTSLVEVEMNEEPTLPFAETSTLSEQFATSDKETKVRGFYSMRYQFESELPFRPYAGAGFGIVATDSETQTGGVLSGRAVAGFDLVMDDQSALFAEYAFVKSGGVSVGLAETSPNGSTDAIPDSEHSLKLGFRHTF